LELIIQLLNQNGKNETILLCILKYLSIKKNHPILLVVLLRILFSTENISTTTHKKILEYLESTLLEENFIESHVIIVTLLNNFLEKKIKENSIDDISNSYISKLVPAIMWCLVNSAQIQLISEGIKLLMIVIPICKEKKIFLELSISCLAELLDNQKKDKFITLL